MAAASPSSLDGLHCWIDADRKPNRGDRLADFSESGPHELPAATDSNPPFHIPYLNGKHALYFPFEKAAVRQKRPLGIVSFGDSRDWRFLFDGSAVFRFCAVQARASQTCHLRPGTCRGFVRGRLGRRTRLDCGLESETSSDTNHHLPSRDRGASRRQYGCWLTSKSSMAGSSFSIRRRKQFADFNLVKWVRWDPSLASSRSADCVANRISFPPAWR